VWSASNDLALDDVSCAQAGNVAEDEMFRTFNMGVGMIVIIDKDSAAAAKAKDPDAFVLGEVVPGRGVTLM
jgi:phosphoribosylformylglycinamidine cyclo-ligase